MTKRMRIRCVLQTLGIALLVQGPLALSAWATDAPKNMVFVILDDLRFDGMGFLTPEVQTPNIDELASRGVYFPNAVVTTSLCSPSRATILTGQTTQNHGIVDNNNSSEDGLVFFTKYLQDVGYETGFFGKWHMGDDTDAPREGFDRWVSFAGQGHYFPAVAPDGSRNKINVDGERVDQQGYITDELTDYAMEWLQSQRDASKPFFLYLSHKAVHSDATPAARHAHQYDEVEFRLPDTVAVDAQYEANKPMWVKNQRNSWHGIDFFYASDRKMTDYLRDYYGALSSVDESLGRIMQYLDDQGLTENTIVFFYSDNGYLIGDHGLIDKRNAYEGSVRVPLVVAGPGAVPQGKVNQARVRNLDLAPTFLDIAGVASPPQFEGQSAWPVMTGELTRQQWNEPDFVYQYYWEWSFPMTPTTFAIVRDDLKYIQYHGIWDIEELYDLKKDPMERVNLINDPDYYHQRQALRLALYEQTANPAGKNAVPYTPRLAEGMNLRDEYGPSAAPFPRQWKVEPNREDKYMGLLPDTPEKKAALDSGKRYNPWIAPATEPGPDEQE